MSIDGSGTRRFDSIEENIIGRLGFGGLIYRRYSDLLTIEAIQRRYAPIGAPNDPRNLNGSWTSGIRGIMDDIFRHIEVEYQTGNRIHFLEDSFHLSNPHTEPLGFAP